MTQRVLYYRLEPVYEPRSDEPARFATGACVLSLATGEILDGRGGPRMALEPEIVEALRNEGRPKFICDSEHLNLLISEIDLADAALTYCRFGEFGECRTRLANAKAAIELLFETSTSRP